MINFVQILQDSAISFDTQSVNQLERRIARASQMSSDGYSLWGQLMRDTAIGVIQSQTDEHKYYFTFIRADGSYGCFDNTSKPCLGQPLYLPSGSQNRINYHNHFINQFNRHNNNNRYRASNTTWKGDWNQGLPCKHVFSLLNAFATQGDNQIQSMLENWIKRSFDDRKRPLKNKTYAEFIQSRFNNVKDQVLQKNVFKPLQRRRNDNYSLYRRSKNVKILEPEDEESEQTVLELHVKITGERVETLPLKNIICISCLQREQDKAKLSSWVTCIQCQNHICGTCFETFTQEKGKITCPSVFNGIKEHFLDTVKFRNSLRQKKKESTKSSKKILEKDVIFKFGYD